MVREAVEMATATVDPAMSKFNPIAAQKRAVRRAIIANGIATAVAVLAIVVTPGPAAAQRALAAPGSGTATFPQQPDGKFTLSEEDLRIKVRGGHVLWTREYDGNRWNMNARWGSLKFEFDKVQIGVAYASGSGPGGPGGGRALALPTKPPETFGGTIIPGVPISLDEGSGPFSGPPDGPLNWLYRNGAVFVGDSSQMSFNALGTNRFIIRPIVRTGFTGVRQISYPGSVTATVKGMFRTDLESGGGVLGWRWQDRNGDWIEYHSNGAIARYGDRNNVTVTFEYEGGRIRYLRDDTGRAVLELVYAGGGLSEVREPTGTATEPARVVRYGYAGGNISTVTDVRGRETRYGYDAKSRLTSITDPESRVQRIFYHEDGSRMARVVAPDGGETAYVYDYDRTRREFFVKIAHPQTAAGRKIEERRYDKEGRLLRVSIGGETVATIKRSGSQTTGYEDKRGNLTSISWNQAMLPVSVRYPDGSGQSISYDNDLLQIRSITDQAGVTTQYDFDDSGNITESIRGAGSANPARATYVVDSDGQITQRTRYGVAGSGGASSEDAVEQFEYDDSGNVIRFTDGEGQVFRYEYDRAGILTRITDPRTNVWRATVDPSGRITEVRDPLDQVVRYSYDGAGDLSEIIDGRQNAESFRYDAGGRLSQTIDALGRSHFSTFDAYGQLTRETDAEGRTQSFEYDTTSRMTAMIDGAQNATRMEYLDAVGSPVSSLWPAKITFPTYTQNFQADAVDRLTGTSVAFGEQQRALQYGYSSRGELTRITDASNRVTNLEYDSLGNPTRYTDPLGRSVTFAWDGRANLLSVSDERDNRTRFAYDSADRLVRETKPLGQQTNYEYNANGSMAASVDANGSRVEYTYDAANRLTRREIRRVAAAAAEEIQTYTYDANSNLTGWTVGSVSATLTYDPNNRKLTESIDYGNGVVLGYAYSYTESGRKRTLTYPDGTVVTYSYDATGLFSGAEIPGEGNISVVQRKWLAPSQVTLPGGTTQSIALDALLAPVELLVKSPAQQPVFSLENDYDAADMLTRREINGVESQFTVDDAGHLTAVSGAGNVTWTLDEAGNRLTQSTSAGTWVYDANNRLTTAGANSYEWDAAGNLLRERVNNVVTRQYVYDGLNRLIEVQDGAGATLASYAYDPLGRRLWKQVGGARTYFLQADEGVLAEANSAGSIITQYGWKPDGVWGTDPLFIRTLLGSGASAQVGYAYFHNDHLGTPQAATDRAGRVVWTANYSPYGGVQLGSSNQATVNLRLAGQYYDDESGLHYNWNRYYDPRVGRYITEDPIGVYGGINLYLYAEAHPLYWIDPYGLNVGRPGTAESFIPIWGSAREAINDFQCGRWGWGLINTGLAALDVFGAGTLIKAGVKTGKHGWKNAVRPWLTRTGFAKKGQQVHHAIVPQRSFGPRSEWFFNQPWNLKPLNPPPGIDPNTWHRMVDGSSGNMSELRKWWNGMPDWFKAEEISYLGKFSNLPRENCECQ